jgi:hypothetical protein
MILMNNPWEKVSIPAHDVFSRRVDPIHPLDLFWARDSYERFLFIYEFVSSESLPDKFPLLNGIEVRLLTPEQHHGSNYMLLLILKDKKDWQIFSSLCNDIIASTREVEKNNQATGIILRRLKRWQEFLQKSRSELLSEKEIKGLIGELFFIVKHVSPAFGIGQAVQFWQGAENMPQDFNIENCAVEVKCQLGTTAQSVHISSVEQLCTQLSKMYLYVVTLGKTDAEAENVLNLPNLISRIRRELETAAPSSQERFNNLIYQTGYVDLEEYYEYSYLLSAEQMFSVEPGFPRICPSDLLPGIDRLTYDINLLDCEPFTAIPAWMQIT